MLKDILRWVSVCGVIAVPVITPFIVATSMFFPYITGKNFTFRIIVEIVFAAWAILAIMDAKYRPRFSWLLSAFALFILVVGVADLFGANAFKSIWSNFERMEGYMAMLHLFAYFVVASSVLNTENLWRAFWYGSLSTSVLIAGIGLQPVFSNLHAASYPRLEATFGNPIYLAVYALFHIFIALVLMLRWRGAWWHQALLGAVVLLQVVTMLLTLTRGTVIGFVGGLLLMTLLVVLVERKRKTLRFVAAGALALVLVLVGTAYAIKDTEWAKTTPLVSRFTQMHLNEGTINARFMNWGMAWQGVKERPILGWGQDNYEYVFSKYYDPNMYGQEPWFDRTHDIIFDWLIAAGFLGLAAYLLISISLLFHMWVVDPEERRWSWKSLRSFSAIRALLHQHEGEFSATERALWTGLLAAYFFHNLFVFDNIVSYILFVSMLAYLQWRVTEGHEPMAKDLAVAPQTMQAVVLPVAFVVSVLVVWYVNVPGIETAQTLISALRPQYQRADGTIVANTPEDMLGFYKQALAYDQLGRQEVREQIAQAAVNMQRNPNVSDATKSAFLTTAREEMKKETDRNPNSARLWLFVGSLETGSGNYVEAGKVFEHAVALTPTKQVALFQLGEVQLVLGKTDAALATFKKAYELQPEYDEARKLYALVLIRMGKDKEAVDLLTEQYGTAAVDDSRLLMEWVNAKRFDIVTMVLEKRAEASPDDLQAQVTLAAAYKEAGNRDKALAIIAKLRVDHPEYADQLDQFSTEIRQGK